MIYRFAVLYPAIHNTTCYLTEPLFLDEKDDLRQVEIDFRSQISGAEGDFQAFGPYKDDPTCKAAIEDKERELKVAGEEVVRVSVYDNEVL